MKTETFTLRLVVERGCKDIHGVYEDLKDNIEIIIGSWRKGSSSYVLAEILALPVVTWKTENRKVT